MAPCETLVVGFTGAVVGQPAIGLSVQVVLKNNAGVAPASLSSWCYVIAGCGFTMPLPSGYSGTPLPGTAGDAGRVSTVAVTIGNPAYTTVGLAYTATVVFAPRPGYNVGGTSLMTAPLLAASPAAVSGSLHYLEAGQYYRVRLRAGGTLQVTGWLGITCTPCAGGLFSVAVFTSGGAYVATIGSRGLTANPRSFVAYSILGDIAAAGGDTAEALRNYELAISILREHGDAQFSRRRSPAGLDDSLNALREKARRVQGRR